MDEEVDIERYLIKRDPDLGRAIKIVRAARGERLRPPPSRDNLFQALVRAVVYQRVSEASGATVYSRIEEIIGGKLSPPKVMSLTATKLKTAGLNAAKAAYIHNIAAWFEENAKVIKKLPSMSDEQVRTALTDIRGVGAWSVNVVLVFHLRRLDVAPAVDPVIRTIGQAVYGRSAPPSIGFMEEKIRRWRPYRSIATMYLYQLGKLRLTAAELRAGRTKIDQVSIRSGT